MVTPVLANTNLPGTEDAYLTKGTGSNGGFDFYANQILIIGTSTVGANIMTQCLTGLAQPSIAIFMGGSFVHIMAEILGAKAKNESHKRKLSELELTEAQLKRTGDVSQKAIMEQQLREEEDTRKFLKQRKLWMGAVSVIYGTATGFAIAEQITFATIPGGVLSTYANCTPSQGILAKGLGMLVVAGYGLVGQSGGTVSQYATMLTGALNAFIPALSGAVKVAYDFPLGRIITFGASTIVGAAVTTGIQIRQNKADDNIEKLKRAIANFSAATEDPDSGIAPGAAPEGRGDDLDPKKKKYELKKLTIDKKKECFSDAGGSWSHSSASCSNPVKLSPIKVGKFNLPAMNNVSRLTTDLGNALAEGDEAKAGLIAGEIGTYAARVETEKNKLKAEFDKLQKKEKNPVNLDKSIAAQVASLNSSLKNTGALKGLESSIANTKSELEKTDSNIPNVTTASSPAIDIPTGDASPAISTEEVVAEVPMEPANQSLDDFESPVQDVSKESEVSIFKQVSNRYILNYTKMFDRKKGLEDSGQPPKN